MNTSGLLQLSSAYSKSTDRIPSSFGVQTPPIMMSIFHNALGFAARDGWYLPYPPADGIAIVPVPAPVNQVPYEQDFLNHCCTFAHELLTDFHPHAPRLRETDSWNTAPTSTSTWTPSNGTASGCATTGES